MDAKQRALWERLEGYRFDQDGASYPFSLRLAEENRWSHAFSLRVIEEYRRFAFLGMAAGHPVSPSHAVDEAWHLHLMYTEEYWKRFCGEVLQRPLHHHPPTGGTTESLKFDDWYAKTLSSYERLFEIAPPRDIWPDLETKRSVRQEFVHVDRASHWVLRKPRLRIRPFWIVLPAGH
jgi:hypothetical protein